jgi:hypothetical protein
MIPFCPMNPQTESDHAEPARYAGGDVKKFFDSENLYRGARGSNRIQSQQR